MTKAELKRYLSENRNDDDNFSEGMKVLLSKMPAQDQWNEPFRSIEEGQNLFTHQNDS